MGGRRLRAKESDKQYIYERDLGICFHCGKPVKRNKMTLDHYYPKSLGGTLNCFNLVCSCKTCNRLKKSIVPKDWEVVNIELFKRAIKDKRINLSGLGASYEEVVNLSLRVDQIIRNRINVIFEAPGIRFYVRDNRIIKIVHFHMEMEALDYI